MKIALFGYGKMGKLIEQIALEQNHQIVAKISHQNPAKANLKQIEQSDVCIDFSQANNLLEHVKMCCVVKKPLIIGTTGWEEHHQTIQSHIEKASIGCLYSPNFSIGVHLFMQIVSEMAKLMSPFSEYDVGGFELHHNQKLDSPSGTAKALSKEVRNQLGRCPEFEFSSVRAGQIPGTHTLFFDSHSDTITLTHQARNREGFARAALKAAEWILDKKGFFTMNDFLNNKTS